MSQLLIIDVQVNYMEWISSADLLTKIPEVGSKFSSIIYLWDNTSGEEFWDQFPEEWHNDYTLNDEGYEVEIPGFINNINHKIEKQYAFFRGFMDLGIDRDSLINLAKFMLNNNIYDFRMIPNDDDIEKKFLKLFKNEEEILDLYHNNIDGYSFYLPDDLINNLQEKIIDGVVLCGGAEKECLAEVALLLDVLDINYTIDKSIIY